MSRKFLGHELSNVTYGFSITLLFLSLAVIASDQEVKETEKTTETEPATAEPPETIIFGDKELALVFHESFENGHDRWETTDDSAWTHQQTDRQNYVFGLNRRKSDYQPKVRSPHNIALIKELELSDFVMTFEVRSTKDTGNHRDCCVFFSHQNESQFYYSHFGAKPDSASGQIMIVNDAPRSPMTENEKTVGWTDDWHKIMITRDATTGQIDAYFDDMETPHMSATDKTFGAGRIGLGSFDDMNDFDNVLIYGNKEEAEKSAESENK
jgi:hypothetical protein